MKAMKLLVLISLLLAIGCYSNQENSTGVIGEKSQQGGALVDGSLSKNILIPKTFAEPLRINLHDECGEVPVTPLPPVDISQPTVVTLSENHRFLINGQLFFPIGLYGVPGSPDVMDDISSAGFNAAQTYTGCCDGSSLDDQKAFLQSAQDAGVVGVVHPFSDPNVIYSTPPADLQALLAQREAYGSLLFWYTFDEPGLWGVPTQLTSDYNEFLHTYAGNHPNALVECPAQDLTMYMPSTDFMMIDPYPVPMFPIREVWDMTLLALEAANGEKGVFGVPQAFDWDEDIGIIPPNHVFRPTVPEMRNMTWQFLALGANGLLYFCYGRITAHPEEWAGLQGIVSEVNSVSAVIAEPMLGFVPVQPNVPYVVATYRKHEGINYMIAISLWIHPVDITFDLSGFTDSPWCAVALFEDGRQVPLNGQTLTDHFEPNEVHVYQIR